MSTTSHTVGASLRFCPERSDIRHGDTGIYVRAQKADESWGNADIAELDRDSLHRWLRSRGGRNLWAENVVMALLGHEQISAADDPQSDEEVSRG
jgi:hypothetical protein